MRVFVIHLYTLCIRTICANDVSWNVDNEIHFQSSLLIVFERLKVFVLFGVELFCVSSQVEGGDMVVVLRWFERFLETVDIIVDEMILFLMGFKQLIKCLPHVVVDGFRSKFLILYKDTHVHWCLLHFNKSN